MVIVADRSLAVVVSGRVIDSLDEAGGEVMFLNAAIHCKGMGGSVGV